ncbi:TPA: APC family permease, partial [Mannheimia haemolytica]|nr:APC family permease [Mannheimia haemolytica]HDL4240226.1 APC family permease [Mannheimia haemolytica]
MKSTKVSFFQAIAISFGAIIGWGAYVMPGDLFLSKGTLLSSSLAIILGTILIYIIAQSYVNLLSITPDNESGGVYWIYKYLNNKHAFIYSWGMLLGYISIISLNISAIPLLIKYLLPSSFRFAFLYTFSGWDVYVSDIFICTLILVLFLFLNYKGIKKGVKFQTFFAILMVCSILILFLGSIINNDSRKEINYISEFNSIKNYLWMSIIAVVPWAFVGFETTPQISRDIKNSKQKSVLIISISIFFGLLFYLMINYITALNMDLNYNDITQSAWATGDGIKNKLGITGMSILSIAMILSILSGINGFILASIKLLESMSKFEIVPEYLLENNRFSNKKSIIFIFYLCVFIPWLGR